MKETYRGYVLDYSAQPAEPPLTGYIISAGAAPPCGRGQVPPMSGQTLIDAATPDEALERAMLEAQSLVDHIAPRHFSNEQLASHQLERALRLFFEEGDYLSAVTLAHASWALFSKIDLPEGAPNSRESFADSVIKYEEMQGKKLTRADVLRGMNAPANAFKHPYGDGRKPGSLFEGSIVEIAADFLDWAVEEAVRATGEETTLMRRFKEWQMQKVF